MPPSQYKRLKADHMSNKNGHPKVIQLENQDAQFLASYGTVYFNHLLQITVFTDLFKGRFRICFWTFKITGVRFQSRLQSQNMQMQTPAAAIYWLDNKKSLWFSVPHFSHHITYHIDQVRMQSMLQRSWNTVRAQYIQVYHENPNIREYRRA